jgi:VIT1/CCC1 family predicted Fe2+/Mn2+ transporter
VETACSRRDTVHFIGVDDPSACAHARDELGISEITTARPVQAALTSAATFSVGAAAPLALALVSPSSWIVPTVSVGSLVFLALLGMIGARAGGASILKPTIRVTFWGALAMGGHLWHGRLIGTFKQRFLKPQLLP